MRPNRRLRTPITNWRRYRRRSLTARMTGRRKEKKDTKDLIKRVKDYLTVSDEMVAPEDMERLAKGVLAIQLPGSLDDILSMIQNIRGMLANFTEFKEDLKKLEDQAKTAQDLLENALDIRPPEMLEEIEALKKKTEMNREQAEQAKADVITALGSATNTKEIQDFNNNKEDKAMEVAMLLEMVESLRREIASRLDGYINSTS
ncbi:laminin subunit beta-4-like isoform X6 [Salmo salar]|uniref:Laminin subunit beta-4-like isoform X6 n=1 Tax=Salmo salar TaxID=8030 RepID=A0ABM3CCU5_SALSA|nr:laminin subunit beta-4-like isoform X6 [Salmo salar]